MVVDRVLGNIKEDKTKNEIVEVSFKWFETEKKRIAKVAADGVEIGVAISENILDGDILADVGDKIYVAKIKEDRLIKIHVSTMKEMGRLCFELGNRHLSLKIEEDHVTIPYEEPTFRYLKKLGFQVEEVSDSFHGYIVCHAHDTPSHSHGDHAHSHGGHAHSHGGHAHNHGDHSHGHSHD